MVNVSPKDVRKATVYLVLLACSMLPDGSHTDPFQLLFTFADNLQSELVRIAWLVPEASGRVRVTPSLSWMG